MKNHWLQNRHDKKVKYEIHLMSHTSLLKSFKADVCEVWNDSVRSYLLCKFPDHMDDVTKKSLYASLLCGIQIQDAEIKVMTASSIVEIWYMQNPTFNISRFYFHDGQESELTLVVPYRLNIQSKYIKVW